MQVREAGINTIFWLSTFHLFNLDKFLLVGLCHADPSDCPLACIVAGERLNPTSEESRICILSDYKIKLYTSCNG